MNRNEIADFLRTVPLEDLGPEMEILAGRVYDHRLKNSGFTPAAIFEQCIGLAGMSVSAQIVNDVHVDGRHIGFALKRRNETEMGDDWAGLYHSTCTTGRMTDTPASMLGRNTKETSGQVRPNESLEFLGVTIHDEPERKSACLTVMHRRRATVRDVDGFVGNWKIFSDKEIREHDKRIVDHNWYLLEWVLDEHRPSFADVRNGWPRQ